MAAWRWTSAFVEISRNQGGKHRCCRPLIHAIFLSHSTCGGGAGVYRRLLRETTLTCFTRLFKHETVPAFDDVARLEMAKVASVSARLCSEVAADRGTACGCVCCEQIAQCTVGPGVMKWGTPDCFPAGLAASISANFIVRGM